LHLEIVQVSLDVVGGARVVAGQLTKQNKKTEVLVLHLVWLVEVWLIEIET
jgi:hypothetical protein